MPTELAERLHHRASHLSDSEFTRHPTLQQRTIRRQRPVYLLKPPRQKRRESTSPPILLIACIDIVQGRGVLITATCRPDLTTNKPKSGKRNAALIQVKGCVVCLLVCSKQNVHHHSCASCRTSQSNGRRSDTRTPQQQSVSKLCMRLWIRSELCQVTFCASMHFLAHHVDLEMHVSGSRPCCRPGHVAHSLAGHSSMCQARQ